MLKIYKFFKYSFVSLCGVSILAVLITEHVNTTPAHVADVPQESDSWIAASVQASCKSAVRERMKAPSTTEFAGYMHVDMAIDKHGIRHYLITGQVDSQNSFGAMLRKPYMCEVLHEGVDRDYVKHVILN